MVWMTCGTVTRTTGITRSLICFAIDFKLDLLCGETSFAAPAFDALGPFADTSS